MLCLPVRTITSRRNPIVAKFRAVERCSRTNRQHLLLDGVRLIGDAQRAGVSFEVAVFSIDLLRRRGATVGHLVGHLEASGVDVVSA